MARRRKKAPEQSASSCLRGWPLQDATHQKQPLGAVDAGKKRARGDFSESRMALSFSGRCLSKVCSGRWVPPQSHNAGYEGEYGSLLEEAGISVKIKTLT